MLSSAYFSEVIKSRMIQSPSNLNVRIKKTCNNKIRKLMRTGKNDFTKISKNLAKIIWSITK